MQVKRVVIPDVPQPDQAGIQVCAFGPRGRLELGHSGPPVLVIEPDPAPITLPDSWGTSCGRPPVVRTDGETLRVRRSSVQDSARSSRMCVPCLLNVAHLAEDKRDRLLRSRPHSGHGWERQ
jgi:hypothetical protein